jgi:hypothetical protein
MSEGGSLVNFDFISKPANTLIEKVSEAVGGLAAPWQVRRMANAEADAAIIKAEARVQISEIEERALQRMIREEGQKQENIENITAKAIPNLSENSTPENIENDWLTHFFDKSRLTSGEEMQKLWAGVLAGEANKPGTFSKRSVDLVASLDKRDAELFTKFCTFCWFAGTLRAFVYSTDHPIYTSHGINFDTLLHLDKIGLITFGTVSGYCIPKAPKYLHAIYYGRLTSIEFPNDGFSFDMGHVLLTEAGKELATVCGAKGSQDFYDYIIEHWFRKGYILSSIIPIKH